MEGIPQGRDLLTPLGAGDLRHCHQRWECEKTIRRKSFARSHADRRTSARAVVFCRWRRFAMEMDRAAAAKVWRHGSPDVARLGSSLQRFPGPEGLIDNRTEGPADACRRNSWLSLRRSLRPARTVRKMASSAGGASISSVSLPKGSASTFIRAMSESS